MVPQAKLAEEQAANLAALSKRFPKTGKACRILAYFADRLTNAICEGVNSLVQAAKRKARGYHTFQGYVAMIYLIARKLKLEVPNPFGH